MMEPISNVVYIGENFGLCRVFFRPVPILLEVMIEGEGVVQRADIATGAGVAIPPPRTADVSCRFDPYRLQTHGT